jgi:putative flippase GtrA
MLQRLFSHVPPEQFFRYLVIGIWNTVFGYSTFAALTYLLSFRWPRYGYIAAGLLASVLNISVAFLGYKKFVFKTKGNYFEEWLRCMAVYGSGIAIGSALLPCAVFIIRHTTALDRKAPYVAAALLAGFNIIYNFLGNKKFAFWKSA